MSLDRGSAHSSGVKPCWVASLTRLGHNPIRRFLRLNKNHIAKSNACRTVAFGETSGVRLTSRHSLDGGQALQFGFVRHILGQAGGLIFSSVASQK